MKKEIPWKTALHILVTASFVIYVLALFYFTIGKSAPLMINGKWQRANLIPLRTIGNYVNMIIKGHSITAVAIINLAGNLLLLLPMAIYLPYFIKALRVFWKDTLAVFAIDLLIEIIEYITARGSFDIDDIILNMLGAIIGYGIWKLKHVQNFLTCGDYCETTTHRYLTILEFTHFVEFFTFNVVSENHREKVLVHKMTVAVAFELETGNTKNPDIKVKKNTIE